MLVINTFLPVVANNLPPGIGSFHPWALLWLLSIIVMKPKLLFHKSVFLILLYGGVVVLLLLNTLWNQVSVWDKNVLRVEFYYFIVAISVIWYFRMSKDYRGLALLTKWTLIFIGITAVLSIYSASIDPIYARHFVGGRFSTVELEYFKRLGGGSYGFAGTLICLFPIMVYYYRNNNRSLFSKKIILIFGILCFIALIRMQIVANILLLTVIIGVSLLGSKKINRSLLLIGIFLIIFLLIPTSFYADLLLRINSYFNPDSHVHYKLTDMAEFINTGDYYGTAVGSRVARYPLLIDAFLKNPIFGYYVTNETANIGAGGHLYWMHKLAVYGLFGLILIIAIHYNHIKTNLRYFDKEFAFFFLISVFSIIALGLMKNLAGREMWFTYFVILPGIYYLPILKHNKKRNLVKGPTR